MAERAQMWFAAFRLDIAGGLLWHEDERCALSPKAFDLLCTLVAHPGQLVSKAALLEAVWPDTVVGDGVLTVAMAELRKVLGDDPRTPQCIETAHRRGYRFIAPLGTTPPVSGSTFQVSRSPIEEKLRQRETGNTKRETSLVGRESELAQLHRLFAQAMNGERQVVFVTGEAGSGKTTLIDAFLFGVRSHEKFGVEKEPKQKDQRARSSRTPNAELFSTPNLVVAEGQCVEHYSAGEAYLPILDALTRLCRRPDGTAMLDTLRQYAPTWLLQMPALLSAAEHDQLWLQGFTTTRDRMVRELADAIAAFAATHPMVLVLEDLHWSDYATLDALSILARRAESAQLLVIGTYRPVEVLRGQHPLRTMQHDLSMHKQCVTLALPGLTVEDIATHLQVRFPYHQLPPAFPRILHQRTNGNPLFLTNMLDELHMQGALVEQLGAWTLAVDAETIASITPATIRALIEQQVDRLTASEQQLLEGASVAGVEFSIGAVAAAVDLLLPEVEAQCEALARQGQFLRTADVRSFPSGTVTAQYTFVHAVYQETLYERVGAARRIRWHQAIAQWLETVAGEQAVEIAAELAVHYEQGRNHERAIHYLEQAARKALRQGAAYEALHHLRTALRLLQTIPTLKGQSERELTLQTLLAPALMTAKGYATTEIEQLYDRILALAQQVEHVPRVFPVLLGVGAFHVVRGKYLMARDVATRLLGIAEQAQDPELLVEAHALMGVMAFYLGEFTTARAQLERGIALYDPTQHQTHMLHYGQDPWVVCCAYLAWTLWTLGYPERAQAQSREAIAYAQQLQHPMSQAFALGLAGILQNNCRDVLAGQARAEELIALATQHGLPYWVAQGTIARGRALVQKGRASEGLVQIQQAMHARQEEDGVERRPTFVVLAEAYAATGQVEAGLQTLAEAHATAQRNGEGFAEAEVYRLIGELTLQRETRDWRPETSSPPPQASRLKPLASRGGTQEAEGYFLKAIDIARQQQAKVYELRAITSLARLWQQQGKRADAHRLLSEIYHWFTEGFATHDLQEAKALLDELSASVPPHAAGRPL